MRCEGSLRPISWSPTESRHVKVWPKLTNFSKKSILRHLEAFFGHIEENKKVLELNFTLETPVYEYFMSILTNLKAPNSRGKCSIFMREEIVKRQGKNLKLYVLLRAGKSENLHNYI